MKKYLFVIFLLPKILYGQDYKSFRVYESEYSFYLTPKQGIDSRFIEYDDKNQELIRSVEYPNYAIEIFDLASGYMKKFIQPKVAKMDVFKKVSNNNYWVHDPWKQTFNLVNTDGEILKEIFEPKPNDQKLISMHTGGSAFCPIIIHNKYLYATGRIDINNATNLNEYKKTGVVEKVAPNGDMSLIGRIPDISQTNYYGHQNAFSATINKNSLIVAPFFTDEIQIIDLNTNKLKIKNLNTKYAKMYKPLGAFNERKKFSNTEKNQHFMQNYSSIGIMYDKYKNVYYRTVRKSSVGFSNLSFCIIVMDSNFKILFEKILDDKYSGGQVFISPKGLAILNLDAYKLNNKRMSFDLFKLVD